MTSPPAPGQHNHAAETEAALDRLADCVRDARGRTGYAESEDIRALAHVRAALAAAEARLAETERQRDEARAAWDSVANAIESGEPLFQILRRRTEEAEASAARAEEALRDATRMFALALWLTESRFVAIPRDLLTGDLDIELQRADRYDGAVTFRAALSAGAEGTAG